MVMMVVSSFQDKPPKAARTSPISLIRYPFSAAHAKYYAK